MKAEYNTDRRSLVFHCSSDEFQKILDAVLQVAPDAAAGVLDVKAFLMIDEASFKRPTASRVIAKCVMLLAIISVLAAGLVKLADLLP